MYNTADSFIKELPLSCVCVFYTKGSVTDDIRTLMSDEYQKTLSERYPGFHYLFLERQRNYNEKSVEFVAMNMNIIARCIPIPSDKNEAILATHDYDEVTLDSFNDFMDELMKVNRSRCEELGYGTDLSINEMATKCFPHELEQSKMKILEQMAEAFIPREKQELYGADSITVMIEPNLKGVLGTSFADVHRRGTEGDWVVALYVKKNRYEIPLSGLFGKAMFYYMLIHPNEEFNYKTFDSDSEGEKELRAIIGTLYPPRTLNDQEAQIDNMFRNKIGGEKGRAFSRNIRLMNPLIRGERMGADSAPDNNDVRAEMIFQLIERTSQIGSQDPGKWRFSLPRHVKIVADKFIKAKESVRKKQINSSVK